MASKQGNINFGVKFNVDKASLSSITTEFQKISKLTKQGLKEQGISISESDLMELQKYSKKLEEVFSKSYNVRLNTVDFDKLKQNLQASGLSIAQFEQLSAKAGSVGAEAFAKVNREITKTQQIIKQTHPLLDKMKDTFANTVRWTIASTALNSLTGSVQKAWGFAKSLDASLTNIRVVTGKSAEEMEVFARKANSAAKALGASTKDYTDAALIYYQQGLKEEDVQSRTNVTLKAANVTGQDARAVSEQLTAVWNGYKVSAQEAELYVDKLSAVAATTASDLEELSVGMSRVASAANIMGVDVDQLNAQMATIVSVTREAPESIGTALKTVYARMSDIQAGIDEETTLGEYTQQMAQMGVNVLDAKGKLRDMGDVVEEIGNKWSTLNRNQQTSLAQTIAGTRQYSRMMALFDNWEMYQQAKTTSETGEGTLGRQNEIVLDSLDKKLEQLRTTTEKLFLALFDNDSFKDIIEGFTKFVDLTARLIENLGGARTLLLSISGIVMGAMADRIGKFAGDSMRKFADNREIRKQIKKQKPDIKGANKALADFDAGKSDFVKEKNQAIAQAESKLNEINPAEDDASQLERLYEKKIEGYNEELKKKRESLKIDKEAAEKEYSEYKRQLFMTEEQRATRQKLIAQIKEEEILQKKLGEQRTKINEQYNESLKLMQDQHKQEYEDYVDSLLEAEKNKNKQILDDYKALMDKKKKLEDESKDNADLQTQQRAQEIFERQTGGLKIDLEKASYEDIDAARTLLQERSNEFKQHGSNFSAIGKQITSMDQAKSTADSLKTEIEYVKEGNIGASDEQIRSLESALARLTAAIEQGDLTAASDAASSAAGVGSSIVEDARKENKFAINAMSQESVKQRRGRSDKRTEALNNIKQQIEEVDQEEIKAAKEKNEKIQDLEEKSAEEKEQLLDENGKKRIELLKEKNKQEEKLLEENKDAEIEIIDETEEASKKVQESNAEMLNADNIQADVSRGVSAISDFAGAAMQLGGVISAVSSLPSIFQNQDMSTGEKVLSLVTTLIPVLFGAFSAIMTAKKGVESFDASVKAAFMTPPLVIIMAILLAVTAAIVGVSAALAANEKKLNADANAAKEAAKRAQELQERYADLRQSYEDLKNSLEDHNKARDAIDDMVAGTKEWQEAVSDLNADVMDLIAKYPELIEYLENEGGVLGFSEEGQKAVLQAKAGQVNSAQWLALGAKIDANDAQVKATQTQLGQTIVRKANKLGANATDDGASIGRVANEMYDEIMKGDREAVYNAVVSSSITENTGGKANTLDVKNAVNAVTDVLMESKTEIQKLQTTIDKNNQINNSLRMEMARSKISGLSIYTDSTDLYAKKVQEMEELDVDDFDSKEGYLEKYNQLLQERDAEQQKQDLLTGAAAAAQNALEKQYANEIRDIVNGKGGWLGKNQKNQLAEKVKDMLIAENPELKREDIKVTRGRGDTGKIVYQIKDEDGNWSDKTKINVQDFDELYAKTMARAAGIDENQVNAAIDKFKTLDENLQTGLVSFLGQGEGGGSFANLTGQEWDTFTKALSEKGLDINQIGNYNIMSKERRQLREMAKALGVSVWDLQSNLDTQNKMRQQEIQEQTNALGQNRDAFMQAIGGEQNWNQNLDQVTQQSFVNMFSDLASIGLQDNAYEFLNKAQGNEILAANLLKDTDWESDASVEAFKEMASVLGMTTEATDNFVISMQKVEGVYKSFDWDKETTKYAARQKVVNSLNQKGDTISEEDYNTIKAELGDKFIALADGTYALIEDADQLKKDASNENNKNALKKIKEARDYVKVAGDAEIDAAKAQLKDAQKFYASSLETVAEFDKARKAGYFDSLDDKTLQAYRDFIQSREVPKAIEEINKLQEKNLKTLENTKKILEDRIALNRLITGSEQETLEELNAQAAAQVAIYEAKKKAFDEIAEKYKSLNPDEITDEIREAYYTAQEAASEALVSSGEAFKAIFEQQITDIIETAFGISQEKLSQLTENQSWAKQYDDKYIEGIEKEFEINTLRRTFQQEINSTANVTAQKRLNDVYQKQIEALEAKVALNERDLQIAQTEFELEKARIALEEAQKRKTSMSLVRGADGTYSYQYVADQNNILQAQQDVADKEKELLEQRKGSVQDYISEIADTYSQLNSTIQESVASDNGFSDAETDTVNHLTEILKSSRGELQTYFSDLAQLVGISVEDLLTNKDKLRELGIDQGLLEWVWGQGDPEALMDEIMSGSENALETFLSQMKYFKDEADDVAIDNLTTGIQSETSALGELLTATENGTKAYDNFTTAAVKLAAAFELVKDGMSGEFDSGAIDSYINSVQSKLNSIKIGSYDTGGYTGEWGPEGKLLLAHEKELILNKTDTANILAAVDVVRSLNMSMRQDLARMGDTRAPMPQYNADDRGSIEQNVTIHADFPGVSDSREIEEAFNQLVGVATQHAFINKG